MHSVMAVTVVTVVTDMTMNTSPVTPLAIDDEADMQAKLNTKVVTWSLGLFAALSFVVCILYGWVTPEAYHMHDMLELALPAFQWLTWWGFLLGLAESFLYGAYVGLVFCPIYNSLERRWGDRDSPAL